MSQTPSVQSLYMVVLMQEDIEKALQFYQNLGLKKIFHLPGKWAELDAAGVRIGLCPTEVVDKGRHTGVVFAVTDMQATYTALVADGVEFVTEPVTATHGSMASCFDPSGNKIDLYQPTHDKVKSVIKDAHEHASSAAPKAGGCCKGTSSCNS